MDPEFQALISRILCLFVRFLRRCSSLVVRSPVEPRQAECLAAVRAQEEQSPWTGL